MHASICINNMYQTKQLMSMCVCVCKYICMHVCTCEYIYTCISMVQVYTCLLINKHMCKTDQQLYLFRVSRLLRQI